MSARSRTARHARAFAMPVALIIVLLVGVVTSLMFERQASQRRLIERQLWWYQEHHARFGVQEVVDAWMTQIPSSLRVEDALGENGHAADLILPDGTVAVLFLQEAQGSLLTDLTALNASEQELCQRLLDQLALVEEGTPRPQNRRAVGPAQVSVNSASLDVLRAVCRAVLDESRGEMLAREIDAERAKRGIIDSPNTLGEAMSRVQVSPEERAAVLRALTTRASLYYLVVELQRSRDAARLARYGGYIPMSDRRRTGQADDQIWGRRTAFLTWDDLGVE